MRDLKIILIGALWLFVSVDHLAAQNSPSISSVDRTRLAEAFDLAEAVGDSIWKNWHEAPFAVLLVTPDYEFLVRHPAPSPGFIRTGYDSLLESEVFYRKRTQPLNFLATFPAIAGSLIPVIVVGQAQNTSAKTSTPWVVSLLHEHFHQWQMSQPDYYEQVDDLGLSRGDQTGMWMLNFPFPYDSSLVQSSFADLSNLLRKAVQTSKMQRDTHVETYLAAREKFRRLLNPDEFKYFSFQLWQEGMARYTEYHIARLAASHFRVSGRFRALLDYTPFADVANSIHHTIMERLQKARLAESRREVFYPFGAAEGLLLDYLNPDWRRFYLEEKFRPERYFNK
jgi:hypothetical protein